MKVVTEALAARTAQHRGLPGQRPSADPGLRLHRAHRGPREKPAGAWTAGAGRRLHAERMSAGDFYILCPDNDVTRALDEKRILWAAGDIVENRPPLSRWHPDYRDAFAEFAKDAAPLIGPPAQPAAGSITENRESAARSDHRRSLSSIDCVISVTPLGVRRKRLASKSGSSPTTRSVGDDRLAADDGAPQPGVPTYTRVGQDHRLVDRRIGIDARAGEQQRAADRGAGDDAALAQQRGDRHTAAPVDVVDKLGRRRDLAIGPDRPSAVEKVEMGNGVGQINVGRPIRVYRLHVAPIDARLVTGHDAGL